MNKKSFFLCLGMLVSVLHAFSQKVDIDNVYFNISNCELPLNFIEPEDRTYKVYLSGNSTFTGADKQQQLKIHGWQRVNQDENATVDIRVTIGSFNYGIPNTTSEVKENKDKDGKVTSKTVTYSTSATNTGNGELVITAPKNEMPPIKTGMEKESKSDKKKQEKEKELAANPFLQNVDMSSEKAVSVSQEKIEAYTYSLSKNYSHSSGNHSSSSASSKAFYDNLSNARNNHQNDYRSSYVRMANNFMNSKYGYSPVNHRARFKKMDSKKHPENDMFNAAITATGEIFKKMRYNKNPEEIKKDLIPILNYFDEVVKKYAGEEKEDIKLRGAALYNMARINQFLDNHDKVVELTDKLVLTGKKNEKATEKFLKESIIYREKLAFHKMKSRHNYSGSHIEEGEEDELGDIVESEDED